MVLAKAARILPNHWHAVYGYRPVLLETFVEKPHFQGICYKAANWLYLGKTKDRGKLGGGVSGYMAAPGRFGHRHPQDSLAAFSEPPAGHREKGGFGNVIPAPDQDGLRHVFVEPPDQFLPWSEGVRDIEQPVVIAPEAGTHVVDACTTVVERTMAQIIRNADRAAGHSMRPARGAQRASGAVAEGEMERALHHSPLQLCHTAAPGIPSTGTARSLLCGRDLRITGILKFQGYRLGFQANPHRSPRGLQVALGTAEPTSAKAMLTDTPRGPSVSDAGF